MRENDLRKLRGRIAPLLALAVSGVLAFASDGYGASRKKSDGMVDYSAPVRVRVKKPASAADIAPRSVDMVSEDMSGAYDGKQVEAPVRREVSVPRKVWASGDLDELPPPAWEDCEKVEPRWRHLDGPHGRISAGMIYRNFGDVSFDSQTMAAEDFHNKRFLPGIDNDTFPGISMNNDTIGDFTGIDPGTTHWAESVDAGGPYLAMDLLFPVLPHLKLGQQTSISYSRLAASNKHSNIDEDMGSDLMNEFVGPDAGGRMYNSVKEHLEADIYTLSLGPLIEFDLQPFFAQVAGGLAINLVNFNADANEQMYVEADFNNPGRLDYVAQHGGPIFEGIKEDKVVETERWEDGNHGTKFLFGMYLQGLLGVNLTEQWSISGFARYDWNQDFEGYVGYSDFNVDLNSFSLGGQLGFSF